MVQQNFMFGDFIITVLLNYIVHQSNMIHSKDAIKKYDDKWLYAMCECMLIEYQNYWRKIRLHICKNSHILEYLLDEGNLLT